MRRLWFSLLALATLLVCGPALALAEDQAPPGFHSLFNGKDLSGWKVNKGGNMAVWGAADGILYVSGEGGGWLLTKKQYSDFEIRLEYKMTPHGNSGVALRSPTSGDPAYVGMEIQLLDDRTYEGLQPYQYTGSVYGVVPPSKHVTRPAGEWNSIDITAKGPHIKVVVNGEKVVDADLTKYKSHAGQHPGILRTKGHLGLQSHTNRVEFRNIYVKEL